MKYTFALIAFVAAAVAATSAQQAQQDGQSFRFRTGVELINVTATVTDASGRFVSGLRKEDFRVYEDEQPQPITHFNAERVPVSLGIVLDASGSMDGDKMLAARQALDRFLFDLLGPDDEVFLYRFDGTPELVEGWTKDKQRISDALRRVQPRGATALYDAVAEALPLIQAGQHRKKALVIISDGNDTSSHIDVRSLQAMIRETEVLVYAIGIDAQADTQPAVRRPWFDNIIRPILEQRPVPRPFPRPRSPRGPAGPPVGGPSSPPIGGPGRGPIYVPPPRNPSPIIPNRGGSRADDRVNVAALRDITDDSGGRTEIIRFASDLNPATAGIADELSRQYYLGYPATGAKDGRWHSIRVEVRNANYRVRARKGYVATP